MGLTAAQAAEIIDVTPNAVYRTVYKGRLAKPVKHQHGGLELADVERASLERHRYGRPHPYWATESETANMLGVSRGRVQQLAVAGRLPFMERGRHRLYRRPQLEVIANAREAGRFRVRSRRVTESQTYKIRYVGPPAIVGALAQALTEHGVTVDYERPAEHRGAGQIAQEVVVNVMCSGAFAAITAGVNKFRASRLGSKADVQLPHDPDPDPTHSD